MIFRNLTMFRFPASAAAGWFDKREVNDGASFSIEAPSACEYLAECQLKPVGPLELSSRGFIPPHGHDSDVLMHRAGNTVWLTIGGEDRILPSAVVSDRLARKLAEVERTEGRKPGGRTRKRIRDELIAELLPQAFVKPSRVDVLIDLDHCVAVVDTASRRGAENAISEIRRALGSFPALPLNAEIAPRSVLTGWVAGEPLPDGMAIGDNCVLRDPVDRGGVVKVSQMELDSGEVTKHLEAGKQVTRLALTLHDHAMFVVDEQLVIRNFRLLDGAIDALENADHDDLRAELDARFALMAGEFSRLFTTLESAFRLSKAEG